MSSPMDVFKFYGKVKGTAIPIPEGSEDSDSSSDEHEVVVRAEPSVSHEEQEDSDNEIAGSDEGQDENEEPGSEEDLQPGTGRRLLWKSGIRAHYPIPAWKIRLATAERVHSPTYYFRQMFSSECLKHIVQQTNLYSVQGNVNAPLNCSEKEIEQFIGCAFQMSIYGVPSTRMCWQARSRLDKIADVMPMRRWEQIKANLHFSDNTMDVGQDPLFKLRPFLDFTVERMRSIPMTEHLSVDEQIIPYKGKSHLKQYNPSKPHKWGYKVYLLCDSKAQTDYAPYFFDNGPNSNTGNLAMFSLSEDTSVGKKIYILNGTDPEGQPIRYGLAFEPGSKEYFQVDPKSGEVTLIEELDREVQDEIEVLVSITDGRNKVTEKVHVFVMDVNDEKPQFQNMPAIVDVAESTKPGSSIYKVEAVDRDTGSGGSLTYFIQSPDTNGKFGIDRHSGVLRIKQGQILDFERSTTHFVTVVAKDGGGNYKGKHQVLSSSATLTINVIDTQDTPPVFVGTPYFGYVYEVSSPGSEIFTVFAKDGDVGNPNPVHYSIDSGADGVFTINKTSGCIVLRAYPANLRKEMFHIKVKASEVGPDGTLMDFATTTVTIRVVDLNNHPPTFYGEKGPQNMFELTMYEHPPEGEILRGLKISVNDSDQGANAKFNLRLVGPGRVLRVVPQTVLNEAQVTILVEDSSAIDYEKSQFLSFKLLAVEIDTPERFSATADVVIHLLDTNDNTPKFSSEYYIARIPENSPGGSNVVTVTATDPDSGLWGEVKYSIYGDGSGLFLIQSQSGIIYTQPWASLDAEVKSKYNFYVKAEDMEGKYSLAEVFVTILDLNDHPPEFNNNFLETTMVIGAPIKIEAIDDDAEEPNNVIEYSIMKTEPDNIFDINADTGEIMLKPYIKSMDIVQNITNQKECTWSVVIQARDRGSPSFSTTTVVKIDITEETQLNGPFASFLLHGRDHPIRILGMIACVICSMLVATIVISTITFVRNKKSNKILPNRRIIRRRQKLRQFGFKGPVTHKKDFEVKEEPDQVENINCNNNVNTHCHGHHHHVIPMRPPDLPPPPPSFHRPSERQWARPPASSSAGLLKPKRPIKTKDNHVNTALVSELKMRFEQKRLVSQY
ncbi:hypothetical protein ACEWY4_021351 [Coilia grayii]|uniref:Photoreceptor cadherin n=1 Tax=Coilia grayii TaxID=363190 RepID=A0ABD1J8T0_9TELE